MLRFILGTLASLAVVILAVLMEGGNIFAYLSVNALAIALLIPFFAVLAVWRLGDWLKAWRDALKAGGDSASAATSKAIWAFFEKAGYAAGGVGFIAGLILVLSHIQAIEEVGRGLAIALTCPMYALLLGLVCRILRARVESKLKL